MQLQTLFFYYIQREGAKRPLEKARVEEGKSDLAVTWRHMT